MRIIISPAKKMREDRELLAPDSLPVFLPEAEALLRRLRELDYPGLKALWHCSDAVARPNYERLRTADLRHHLTPAVLAYVGIQYQYMAPGVFDEGQFAYIREHLRILSGLYGLLRPNDGVTPYRLEMQARLAVGNYADLYAFWGGRLAARLAAETDCVLNLASREYSRAVTAHLPPGCRMLTCRFGERRGGRIVEKATVCKMARGEMVRWLAENRVARPGDVAAFDRLGYRLDPAQSGPDRLVFCKGGTEHAGSR